MITYRPDPLCSHCIGSEAPIPTAIPTQCQAATFAVDIGFSLLLLR